MWLKGQGVSCNANQLSKHAGIAPSSALGLLKKINLVINSHMQSDPLAVGVVSALFAAIYSKRSTKTPADEHPVAEQNEMEKLESNIAETDQNMTSKTGGGVTAKEAISLIGASQLSAPAKQVLEILSKEPVHINSLCEQTNLPPSTMGSILTMLDLDGLIESRPGDLYVRGASPTSTGPAIRVSPAPKQRPFFHSLDDEPEITASSSTSNVHAFISCIKTDFQGISRKYVQLYLAGYWCHVDRGRWSFDSLLSACGNFREVSYQEILAFVSPLVVKVMPC
jgi:hypothetical protein